VTVRTHARHCSDVSGRGIISIGCAPSSGLSKRLFQRRHFQPVELDEVEVEEGCGSGARRDLPFQLLVPLLERDELVFEAPGRHALGDRLDDAAEPSSTIASIASRRMLSRLEKVPLLRAVEQPKKSALI
jgi:hypothetical protein